MAAASNETADVCQASDISEVESVTPSTNSFASIQKAVDNAKESDTIELNGTYYGSGKPIKVSKSLKFKGINDATLDAKKLSGIITSDYKKNLVFTDITFINTKGSAISRQCLDDKGIKLEIYNCTFKNICGEETYAIDANSHDLTVYNSKFINNDAAIQSYSDYDSNIVSVTNCTFNNNHESSIQATNLRVFNSDFTNNGNNEAYGGNNIFCLHGLIYNSRFINNSADQSGGAISIEDAGSLSVTNSTFIANSANWLGGAIYASENLNIFSCKFINNTAYNGAAIFFPYGNTFNIYNTQFENNSANYSVVYCEAEATFTDCKFKNNNYASIISKKATLTNCNSVFKTINSESILNDNLNKINLVKITVDKVLTTYKSGAKLTVLLVNAKTGKPIADYEIEVRFKDGKKSNIEYVTTNSKGKASIDVSKIDVGNYTVKFKTYDLQFTCPLPSTSTTVTVKKAKTTLKANKVTFKYKKSKYFKVKVNYKESKKPVKKVKIKVKVYTGKKSKTYTIKTDKTGLAKLNTKKLSKGKHKVKIKSANKNYSISGKSSIKIK